MYEEDSLLEYMLQEASNIQRVELSHHEIKALLEGTAEAESGFEEYQEMTLEEFFYMNLQKVRRQNIAEAEALFTKNNIGSNMRKNKVFGKSPDSTVKVGFEENDVKMYVYITAPEKGGKKIPPDMLQNILQEYGVVYGINELNVKRLSRTPIYHTYFTIAEGMKAINGEDGKLDFEFNTEKKLAPKQDESGKIDYKELGYVRDAKEGDVLCRITKPTSGADGMNVFGKIIKAKPGQKVRADAGKNTKVVEEDGYSLIVAACDGQICYIQNKVFIDKVLTVQNVDGTTGNLNFIGSIHVKGSVHAGFEVQASGNITVDGIVEDGKLSANGDIAVRGGIKGSGMSKIKAKGEVRALFIENATVFAKKNIYADYVLNSQLECERKITLSGKYGFMIGGTAKAVEIIAKEIGSPKYILTKVELNYPKDLLQEIAEVRRDWKRCQQDQEEKAKDAANSKDTAKSEENKIALFEARMTEKRLETRLIQLEGRLAEIKKKASIGLQVEKQLYPNVTVLMEYKNYHNKEVKERCSIRKIDEKWKIKYENN